MTEAEKAKLDARHQRRSWAAIVAIITIVVSMMSTGLIVAVMGAQAADTRDRNHEVSVCTLSFFHDASAASGKSPEDIRRAFDEIFQEQWLIDNCALTPAEAQSVLGDR